MQDFPGNSQKGKARPPVPAPEERPKVERITEAKQRKRGLGRKFKETFVLGSTRDAVDYMVVDIVVPAVKDTIVDALQGGVERLFNGESIRPRRSSSPSSSYSNVPHINYQGMSKSPTAQPPRALSRRSRTMHDFGEIIIDNRRDAEEVRDQMYEVLSRLGVVHVADLYEMTNIQSSHVDHKWGWTSLQGTKLVRTRDGRFLLDLPEPIALN